MATLQDAAKCPCSRADEETDGDTTGHWLMIRRETLVDYQLPPFEGLPSHEELAALLHPDDADVEQETREPGGGGVWTVTCERRCENGEATQAMWLRDALDMWLSIWDRNLPAPK
jgi:hypothetical protein